MAGDEGAVGRVEIAQAVTAIVEVDLEVGARHPLVGDDEIALVGGADADPAGLDLGGLAGVRAAHHRQPAAADLEAAGASVDDGDPLAGAEIVWRSGHSLSIVQAPGDLGPPDEVG